LVHARCGSAFGIIQTRLRGLALVHARRGVKPSASSKPASAGLLWCTPGAALAVVIVQNPRCSLALVHGFDAAKDFALPNPASAGLLWYTPGAALAVVIVQNPRCSLALVHGFDAARDFTLPKTRLRGLALVHARRGSGCRHCPKSSLQPCSGAWHCPTPPPRACFGARPARLWLSSLSKILAAALLWCMGLTRQGTSHCPNPPPRACFGARPARHQAFGIIQTRLRGLALVHARRGVKPSASSKPASAGLLWCTPGAASSLRHHPNPPPRACFGVLSRIQSFSYSLMILRIFSILSAK